MTEHVDLAGSVHAIAGKVLEKAEDADAIGACPMQPVIESSAEANDQCVRSARP